MTSDAVAALRRLAAELRRQAAEAEAIADRYAAREYAAELANSADDLLTPAEVADMRGRSVGYLAKERSQGGGPPFYKDGQLIRYRRGDVAAWMRERFGGTLNV